ncbi:MAG: membrane protein, partial [Elusimicrobia bacterium]
MTATLQTAPRRAPSSHELAWLAEEIPSWTRDGLLTDDQARRIRARYDFAEVDLDRRAGSGRFVQALSVLGALLVGAGILTWIAANWDGIGDPLKLGLIFTSVIGLQWGGYELAFRRASHPHLGQALLLIGNLAFGAGIFLVAQIFHLSGHWPNAFLAWGLGALAVAVAVEAVPVFTLAAGALTVWGIGEAAEFHATGLWSLAAVGALFAVSYWRNSKSHLAVSVMALGAWLSIVPGAWHQTEEMMPTAWLAGAGLLVAAGVLHRSLGRPDLQAPWRTFGIGGGMFAIFLMCIRFFAHEFSWQEGARPAIGWVWAVLAVAAAVAAWALVVASERLARLEAWAALGAVGL